MCAFPNLVQNAADIQSCGSIITYQLLTCICSFIFVFVHFYPPFTRKRIVSLYFGRDVSTRLGVAIFEVSGPPVFHIKAEASR